MKNQLLEKHLDLVIEANKIHNITRIESREKGILLHIEDSLSALPEIQEAPEGPYADLGSGAGYPGIPLAIETNRETVLVESVGKKARLLEEFIKELELNNVSVYSGRIEDLSKEQGKRFSVVTARALSSLPSLIELASPLLKMDGLLICYKAHVDEEEKEHACSLEKKLGMALKSVREFTLSDNETYRTIYVFQKVAKPKVHLPRKSGQAQKNPY